MPDISDIRRQSGGAYDDLSDEQLATAIHKKFYSDIPRNEFNTKIGFTPASSKDEAPTSWRDTAQAAASGFINDMPIVGPAIHGAAMKAAAAVRAARLGTSYDDELKHVTERNTGIVEQNPTAATVGGVAGNINAMIPLGGSVAGSRALGITGPSLLGRVGAGATSGAAIGAADTAVRGGDITTGTGIGAAGGAIGPVAGTVVGRIASPLRTPPQRQTLVNVLEREGVPMTAGDITGNRPLRWMESTLGDLPGSGGVVSTLKEDQGRAFNRAAAQRMGTTTDLLEPDAMRNTAQRLGQDFERLSARNTLQYDQQFAQDVANTVGRYDRVLPSQQKEIFHNYINDIVGQPGGMSGQMYQTNRSDLSRHAKALRNSDPSLSGALRGLREALDGAMNRSISPVDSAEWQAVNSMWGNMKDIQNAMSRAGPETAQGMLNPQHFRSAVSSYDRPAYVRGQGDLAELSRAGAGILAPLPQSGTGPRAFMSNLAAVGLPILGGGALGAGATKDYQGALMGAIAPGALARILLSGPGQRYLANQAAGPATQEALARVLAGVGRKTAQEATEEERRRANQ